MDGNFLWADENRKYTDQEKSWKPLLRQLLVSSGVWTSYFMSGLALGTPTVIVPQMRKEANTTASLDLAMVSWISTAFISSSIPWLFILLFVSHIKGRKLPFIFVCITQGIGFIILYVSKTTTHVIISQIFEGVGYASDPTLSLIIVSEYTEPKHRGILLTIKSASIFWGIWVANAIGTFMHWRYIAVCGITCALYTTTAVFWPESPHWLASKQKFDECKTSFRWLNGSTRRAEKELHALIKSQSEREAFKIESIRSKPFYKPLLISILLTVLYHLSGKMVYGTYVIDIVKKITNNESAGYTGMLILDGVTVVSMYTGCALSKILKRRVLLLSTGALAFAFLYIIALYSYLVKSNMIAENAVVIISLLTCFCILICLGPMILITSLYGELVALRFKTVSILIISLVFCVVNTLLLKLSPYIIHAVDLHGLFLFNATSSSVIMVLLYIYLPETKDMALHEIEIYFKDGKAIEEVESETKSNIEMLVRQP